MKDKKNIFKDKKILITGVTGFLGSWAAIWALESGASVIGISRTEAKGNSNFSSCRLKQKISMEKGSIADKDFLYEVCEKHKPDYIIHLAGQAIDDKDEKNGKAAYEVNILGTLAVLESACKYNFIQGCVFVTTSKCYVDMNWKTSYSRSKGCADILIETYYKKYFSKKKDCAIVNVILCNVIGGGDFGKNRLIPYCIESLINRKNIEIKTPEDPIYFNSVFEVINGIYCGLESALLLQDRPSSSFFELKYKKRMRVGELVDMVKRLYYKDKLKSDKQVDDININMMHGSNKIKFSNQLPIQDIILSTIEWYVKSLGEDDIYELCAKQLRQFKVQLEGETF